MSEIMNNEKEDYENLPTMKDEKNVDGGGEGTEVETENVEGEETKEGPRLVNGLPSYVENDVVRGLQIFERIGWDDRVGATYLASAADKELVLRVDNSTKGIVTLEAAFLKKAEEAGEWRKFSQIHSSWVTDHFAFLALYFRSGPTLSQCFEFCGKKFSLATAARLGQDILSIIRSLHSLGYLSRCLNVDLFHFDAASRHLFMADISNIRPNPMLHNLPGTLWVGGSLLAPLAWHSGSSLTAGDEVEAWFYLMAQFVSGELPWQSGRAEDVFESKKGFIHNLLFPSALAPLAKLVQGVAGKESIADSDWKNLDNELMAMWKTAGVKDHDDNLDFERDPNEEELPKFVMERIPID